MSQHVRECVGPTEILAARFDNQNDADIVRLRIEDLGYDRRELSFINDATKCSFTFDGIGDHATKAAVEGILGGGALGTALGAGAAMLATGSLMLLGPIGLVTGAVSGGVSALLLGLGLNSDHAAACEEAVNGGSVVMTVQTHVGDSSTVRLALGDHVIAAETDDCFSAAASPISFRPA